MVLGGGAAVARAGNHPAGLVMRVVKYALHTNVDATKIYGAAGALASLGPCQGR